MSREQDRLVDYLDHILEAIRRISRYTANMDEPAFACDEMVQDAVIRNIEIIGEGQQQRPETLSGVRSESPRIAFGSGLPNA